MKKRHIVLLVAAIPAVAVIDLWSAEALELVTTGTVQLVAKEHAPVVAVLHAGQRSRIYGCYPRESDVDVELRVGAKNVVALGHQFAIERRPATLKERITDPWVTASCVGLLGG
jgi:hypothetical protein